MPKVRAKLSEKQERILIQAQLMGLTERDMVQIGNRLMALKKESDMKKMIAETIEGYTWESKSTNKHSWLIRTPNGYEILAEKGKKTKPNYFRYGMDWKMTVTKPGTKFKPREWTETFLNVDYQWKKSLMPENNKDLFCVIKYIKSNLHRIQYA